MTVALRFHEQYTAFNLQSLCDNATYIFADSIYTERYMGLPTDEGNTYEVRLIPMSRKVCGVVWGGLGLALEAFQNFKA